MRLEQVKRFGSGLNRPECVLATASGHLITSTRHENGGVSIVTPSGTVRHITANHRFSLKPNGIALDHEGNFLLAHPGDETGGVYRLRSNRSVETVLDNVNGQDLPPYQLRVY